MDSVPCLLTDTSIYYSFHSVPPSLLSSWTMCICLSPRFVSTLNALTAHPHYFAWWSLICRASLSRIKKCISQLLLNDASRTNAIKCTFKCLRFPFKFMNGDKRLISAPQKIRQQEKGECWCLLANGSIFRVLSLWKHRTHPFKES